MSKEVKVIEITDEVKKDALPVELKIYEITNHLIENNLCGLELTMDNGWKVSLKNKRLAKQIGVPMN